MSAVVGVLADSEVKLDLDSQRSVSSLMVLDPGDGVVFEFFRGPKTNSLGLSLAEFLGEVSADTFLGLPLPYFFSRVDHFSSFTDLKTLSDIWATLVSISLIVSAKISDPRRLELETGNSAFEDGRRLVNAESHSRLDLRLSES